VQPVGRVLAFRLLWLTSAEPQSRGSLQLLSFFFFFDDYTFCEDGSRCYATIIAWLVDWFAQAYVLLVLFSLVTMLCVYGACVRVRSCVFGTELRFSWSGNERCCLSTISTAVRVQNRRHG
jgi:hypothetical protein